MAKNPMDESRRHEMRRGDVGQDKKEKKMGAKSNASGKPIRSMRMSYSARAAAAGKDIGKPGKNFSKISAKAAKEYGSAAAGKRVAGAVLNKLRRGGK